jgi:hypothetical protein
MTRSLNLYQTSSGFIFDSHIILQVILCTIVHCLLYNYDLSFTVLAFAHLTHEHNYCQ